MCCEICPRYSTCEEEGNLNELCCVTCPDHHSCYGKDRSKDEASEESEDALDEV